MRKFLIIFLFAMLLVTPPLIAQETTEEAPSETPFPSPTFTEAPTSTPLPTETPTELPTATLWPTETATETATLTETLLPTISPTLTETPSAQGIMISGGAGSGFETQAGERGQQGGGNVESVDTPNISTYVVDLEDTGAATSNGAIRLPGSIFAVPAPAGTGVVSNPYPASWTALHNKVAFTSGANAVI